MSRGDLLGDLLGDLGEINGNSAGGLKGAQQGGSASGNKTSDWKELAARTRNQQEQQVGSKGDFNGGFNGEQGWHQVVKRRKNQLIGGQKQHPGSYRVPTFLRKETEEAYKIAFKEGRCFRCLSKDHKRASCREPVRCFKCKGIGHKYGGCRYQPKQELKSQQNPPLYKHTQHHGVSYAGVLKPPYLNKRSNLEVTEKPQIPVKPKAPQTEPKNKKAATLGKVNMDDLWEVRPEETQVYMPIREELRPQNMNLWRTGMVVMTQGPPTDDIPGLLARRLSRQYGEDPHLIEVYSGNEEDDAPYVLMVQNRDLLKEIVWNSPYTLRRGYKLELFFGSKIGTWYMSLNHIKLG